jgi:hypothetical protein
MIHNNEHLERNRYWIQIYKAEIRELEKESLSVHAKALEWNRLKIEQLEKEIEEYLKTKQNE